MSKIVLRGRKVVGGCAEGEALVTKSLGAAVRTSKGSPPAPRTASFTFTATPYRWLKPLDSSEEVLTTAIFGFSMSVSLKPSARHCARRTAQREVPGSKLLRSFRLTALSW